MTAYGWFKEGLEKVKDTFEYKLAGLELGITEKIIEIMDKKNISRAELAKHLKVSKPAVSKLLNNGSNITVKRLLAISEALDCNLQIDFAEKSAGFKSEQTMVYQFENHLAESMNYVMTQNNATDDYQYDFEEMPYAGNEC